MILYCLTLNYFEYHYSSIQYIFLYIIACYILSYHISISYYTMFHYFILCVCCIYARFFLPFLTWLHTFSYLVLYSGVILYILSSSLFYYSSATKTTYYHSQLLLYFHYFLGGVCEPRLGSVPLWKTGSRDLRPDVKRHRFWRLMMSLLWLLDPWQRETFVPFMRGLGGWLWLEIISGFRIWQWGYDENIWKNAIFKIMDWGNQE